MQRNVVLMVDWCGEVKGAARMHIKGPVIGSGMFSVSDNLVTFDRLENQDVGEIVILPGCRSREPASCFFLQQPTWSQHMVRKGL